jgi:tetratricopeptide (TPR) repeat protein
MNIRTIGKKIITFYSYKGGVGRTQLLANLAAFFCFYRNKKILVLDWDLEAPGLHFYFGIDKQEIQKGTIDLFQSYVDAVRSSEKGLNESEMPYFDESYILSTKYKTEKGGRIDFISAGKQDENFTNKVNDFGWQHFYKNLDGAPYIEVLKTKLKELDYDYIFVDSRTGINDYSGICNIQFPDINVIIAAPNYQNLNGSLDICKKITESPYMKLEIDGIPIRKPFIYPILSRLDQTDDTNSSEWIVRFSEKFDSYIQKTFKLQSLKLSSMDFVKKTNIHYVKELSYKETIVFEDGNKNEDKEENFSGIKEQFQQLSKFFLDEKTTVQTKDQQQSKNQDSNKPKNEAEAYLNMGNSFYFLGKYEEAKEQYLKAIEIKQDSHDAWNNLGLTYKNLQNYEEAIICYKKAIEIKEDKHEAWYNLGNTYNDLQNYEEAINCYKKAIEIKQDNHEAWNNLGVAYKNLQNYEEAINCYKKAIEIKEDYHEAWYNLGITYNDLQNYEEAINCYKKAIEIKEDYHDAWYNLACMYSLQKEKEKSLSYLEKTISLNPTKYKSEAKQDEDFKNLWEDKDFLALVGE